MSSTLHHQGTDTQLNISGAAVALKAAPGRVVRVVVNTAGSTAGAVNDAASTDAAAAANLVANIPNTVNTVLFLDFPLTNGLVVTPGTGQVLSVSFT